MPIKYLCIDDQDASEVEPLLTAVSEGAKNLQIILEQPKELGPQLKSIREQSIDGLIIDLRLDQYKSQEKYRAPYRGMTLAQELRTRMTDNKSNSFPIVLWSVDSKLKKVYEHDTTSHDLFDEVYVKDSKFTDEPDRVAVELKAMATGYKTIESFRSGPKDQFFKILGLDISHLNFLDPRIGEKFLSKFKYPAHEYAKYILRELIDTQGPLIDEKVLAARLGIDIDNSPDWDNCKKRLESCTYKGAFFEAWPRWWMSNIESWWTELKEAPSSLRRISAAERVKFLIKSLRLKNLCAATTIEEGYSERFWTICKGLNAPLDPIDGLRAKCPELKAWQDTPVLSIKAALERTGRDKGIVIHPLERERLAEIKKGLR